MAANVVSVGQRVAVAAPHSDGVFLHGFVHNVRGDIVTIELDWDLADGTPAMLHTALASVAPAPLAVGQLADVSSPHTGGRFCTGRVTEFPRQGMVKLDLEWNLADGRPASLCTATDLVRPRKGAEVEQVKHARQVQRAQLQEQKRALAKVLIRELEQKMSLCSNEGGEGEASTAEMPAGGGGGGAAAAGGGGGGSAQPKARVIDPSPRQAAAYLRRITAAVKDCVKRPVPSFKKHVVDSFSRVGWSFAQDRALPGTTKAPTANEITLLLMDLLEGLRR